MLGSTFSGTDAWSFELNNFDPEIYFPTLNILFALKNIVDPKTMLIKHSFGKVGKKWIKGVLKGITNVQCVGIT